MNEQLNSYVAWTDGRVQKAGKVMKVWKTKIAVLRLQYRYDTLSGAEYVFGDEVEAPGDGKDLEELVEAKKYYRKVDLAEARQITLETGRQRRRADELAQKRAQDKAKAMQKIRDENGDFAESIAAMDAFGMGELRFVNGSLDPCRMTYVVKRSKTTVCIDYAVWWLPDAEGDLTWSGPRCSTAYVSADWTFVDEKPVAVMPADAVQMLLAEVIWEYHN